MKIRVKINEVEVEIIDSDVNGYPRVVSTDMYKEITKSERLIEVLKDLTTEAIRAYNETKP